MVKELPAERLQKSFSDAHHQHIFKSFLSPAGYSGTIPTKPERAKALSCTQRGASVWLVASPTSWQRFSDATFSLAFSLYVGQPISAATDVPRKSLCKCPARDGIQLRPENQPLRQGEHALSCLNSRSTRHARLVRVAKMALSTSGLPLFKDPEGRHEYPLDLEDGKTGRIEIAIRNPLEPQKLILVDIGIVNICNPTNVQRASLASTDSLDRFTNALITATMEERRKTRKYTPHLVRPHEFYPAVVETTGAYGPGFQKLLNKLSEFLRARVDEQVAKKRLWWIKRRFAFALHRENALMYMQHLRLNAPVLFSRLVDPAYYDPVLVQADIDGVCNG